MQLALDVASLGVYFGMKLFSALLKGHIIGLLVPASQNKPSRHGWQRELRLGKREEESGITDTMLSAYSVLKFALDLKKPAGHADEAGGRVQ